VDPVRRLEVRRQPAVHRQHGRREQVHWLAPAAQQVLDRAPRRQPPHGSGPNVLDLPRSGSRSFPRSCLTRRSPAIRSTGARVEEESTAAPALARVLAASVAMATPASGPPARRGSAAPSPQPGLRRHRAVDSGAKARLAFQVPLRRAFLGDGAAEGDDVERGARGGRGVREVERRLERAPKMEPSAASTSTCRRSKWKNLPPPCRRAGVGALPVAFVDVHALEEARHEPNVARHDGAPVVRAVPGREAGANSKANVADQNRRLWPNYAG
jgi:hypothetical protein